MHVYVGPSEKVHRGVNLFGFPRRNREEAARDPFDGRWHAYVDGKSYGPYTGHHISSMAAAGEILDTDLVCSEGGSAWVQAKDEPILQLLFLRSESKAPPRRDSLTAKQLDGTSTSVAGKPVMRILRVLLIIFSILGALFLLGFLDVYEIEVNPAIVALGALMLIVNAFYLFRTASKSVPSRLANLFSLWIDAKERELKDRAPRR